MKAKIISLALIASLAILVSSPVFAQVPERISYQGKLVTPAGGLMDATVSMRFRIYTDSTGGTSLWEETHNSVTVSKSVFNVILGSVTSIPDSIFDGSIRYLGVKVGNDSEMTPRKPIVSVGYAYKAGTDGDWTFRITDTADTTLITGGAWGIARYGNTLYGNADSTHVNLGVQSTTGTSGQNYKYCTVGGGFSNTASERYATVGGGTINTASEYLATVGGGGSNIASGNSATVGGGVSNTASGPSATIGGGGPNTASGLYATIGGGYDNTASGQYATIGGGYDNTPSGQYATVGGGYLNTANGYAVTVPGGYFNIAAGDYSFAAGRQVNLTSTADNTFAFGYNFTASTAHAVIFYDNSSEMKVGIQTTSPTNILTVKQNSTTDPIADAWTTYSSREYKRDIHELTSEEYAGALQKVLSVPVVRFHYKGDDTKEKIGIIAEDAPEEILAEGDNKAISLNEYISLLHAALKAQQEELDALKAKLAKLESNR